jgi:hypothetical protein
MAFRRLAMGLELILIMYLESVFLLVLLRF